MRRANNAEHPTTGLRGAETYTAIYIITTAHVCLLAGSLAPGNDRGSIYLLKLVLMTGMFFT